jgi:thiol-disulfide isomerase/thioredoxin
MTTRWVAAAAASIVGGALAVPMILGNGESVPMPETRPVASHERATPGCKAEKKADLNFTLKDMNGADVRLSDFKSKVLLLNFWGTWCAPCRAEIPELIKIADKYKDKGVVVLGLAQQDTPEDLRAFAAEQKMNYPSLLSTEEVEEAFGPMWAVPMSFIVDRAGSICFKHIGPVTMPQVEKALQPLL